MKKYHLVLGLYLMLDGTLFPLLLNGEWYWQVLNIVRFLAGFFLTQWALACFEGKRRVAQTQSGSRRDSASYSRFIYSAEDLRR